MKVVLATHHYPPEYSAGVELITERAAHWLSAHGHSVEVVCVESIDAKVPFSVRVDEQDGVQVHRLSLRLAGTGEHLGLRFRDGAVREWFDNYLARSQPDVFHSQSSYLLTASLVEAAQQARVPTVVTFHDYWYLCPRVTLLRSNGQLCTVRATPNDCAWCLMGEKRRYRLLDTVGRRLPTLGSRQSPHAWPINSHFANTTAERQMYLDHVLRSADRIISPAELARELLLQDGFPPDQVRLVRYGLDLARWRGLPRMERPELRIGYLGQLAPHKGVHLLIQAFRRLHGNNRVRQLKIYGDERQHPRYANRLRRLAANHPRIQFCGPYANDQVEEILTDLDVVVVPSIWFEVSPLVIMEAFTARVPVVASRLPNMQYQVNHGVDGLLFEANDVHDLARQLQHLLDRPGLVKALSAGIAPVRTVGEEMAEIVEVYASAIEDASGRALLRSIG